MTVPLSVSHVRIVTLRIYLHLDQNSMNLSNPASDHSTAAHQLENRLANHLHDVGNHGAAVEVPRLDSLAGAHPQYYPVSLEVGDQHITKMDYFFNEVPMCDHTTQNAVSAAIRDVVDEDCQVSTTLSNEEAVAIVGDDTCRLGSAIGRWLKSAISGAEVQPFRQTVWLPVKALQCSTPLLSVFSPPPSPSRQTKN